MNKKETENYYKNIIGSGLSCTSKMPSYSFNLSALHCKMGAKLVHVDGSTCQGCYALKGNYVRYKHITNMIPKTAQIFDKKWVEGMTWLIINQDNKKDRNFFRWHDSGDIQNMEHLVKIVQVCKNTPKVRHWLPTREYKTVKTYLKTFGDFPKNLTVRISGHMIDQKPPKIGNLATSTVNKNKKALGLECKSYKNEGQCLDCRLCWDSYVENISYKYH